MPHQTETTRCKEFSPKTVQGILDDRGGRFRLSAAFTWDWTPEGHEYWYDAFNASELSAEVREKLEAMMALKPHPDDDLETE